MLERLIGWARYRDVDLAGLTVARPSLEDVYLELVEAAGGAPPMPEKVPAPS